MSTTTLQGKLAFDALAQGNVRIAGLDENRTVCAETAIDRQGRWQLACPVPIAAVIAQLTGSGIAAAVAAADDAATLRLPPRHPCRIEFASNPQGARLWVDPLSLDGFPDRDQPALRVHPGGTVDLHLGDYACGPDELVLHLQAGRYRIDGGTVALHPGEAAVRIAQAEILPSGQLLPVVGGEFVFDLDGGTADGPTLRISFASSAGRTP